MKGKTKNREYTPVIVDGLKLHRNESKNVVTKFI